MSKVLEFLKDVLDLFVKKFPAFIATIAGKIPKELKSQLFVLVEVVNNIKNFVDGPTADFLTAIIPGTADDKLKEWLRKVLPGILRGLGVITVVMDSTVMVNLPDDRDFKGTKLKDIGSLLTKELIGSCLTQGRYTYDAAYKDYQKQAA